MAQVIKKFIGDNQVADEKIRLDNNQALRSRNAANSADVDLLKANASDLAEFGVKAQHPFAPTVGNDVANKTYVDAQVSSASVTFEKENFTLAAGDITNQYIDLANVAKAESIDFVVSGLVQTEGTDYTVNLTGGAGGNTRLTFAGPLATSGASELIAGDVVVVKYAR